MVIVKHWMETSGNKECFRVQICSDATFLVAGQDPDDARQVVIDYCNDNRFLGLDPEMMFPHAIESTTVPEKESRALTVSSHQLRTGMPLLTVYRSRSKNDDYPNPDEVGQIQVLPNQLALFGVDRSVKLVS